MSKIEWRIGREGHRWSFNDDGFDERWEGIPHKTEFIDGKIYWSDEQRMHMLAFLLEQMGMDAALRVGDPQLWKEAIDARLAADEKSDKS